MMENACVTEDWLSRSSRLRLAQITVLMGFMEANKPAALSEQTVWMLAVRDDGDLGAYARLFDFYGPRVKAMAMRTGVGASEAEDIVQDVMLRVWQARGQFDPSRAQASGWIYQIARNRGIDLARRLPRALPEDITAQPGPREAADALALEQEVARLREALRALPADQREMIERAYLGELTHQQISHLASLPLGTVKSRLRLAIERLRHELRELRK